jgi:DNA invertase Pin-like site-specific DNA recombinase
MIPAVAYFRTSSAANVGEDKDSEKRQRDAVTKYAKQNKIKIVGEFYDAAVSGRDLIEDRPGFSDLLDKLESNNVHTVLVEGIDRLARDMQAGVLGLALLRARGVTLLDATGANLTDDADEMTEAMISISLVFATLEKKRLVKKLRHAREEKRVKYGKCEGRKPLSESDPFMAMEAKRLRRKNPKTGKRLSLRAISMKLAANGFFNHHGKPYSASSIRNVTG